MTFIRNEANWSELRDVYAYGMHTAVMTCPIKPWSTLIVSTQLPSWLTLASVSEQRDSDPLSATRSTYFNASIIFTEVEMQWSRLFNSLNFILINFDYKFNNFANFFYFITLWIVFKDK